jgi:glycine cleavage system T protein (aminomethyltransferase)
VKRTPLYDVYNSYEGVKIIDFGGWELPVNFATGILDEHFAVRNSAGLFDVSHMGEVIVEGSGSGEYVDSLMTNTISNLGDGEVMYTLMCYPDGGVVDDLLVYRIHNEKYFLVINAANIEKDFSWIASDNPGTHGGIFKKLTIENVSEQYCQIAVQGPSAETVLHALYPEAGEISFFTFVSNAEMCGHTVLVSRTGYTGEDGFEIYCSNESAPLIWNALLETGKDSGLIPCGLGARDSLRLEAKLPLYGHEISSSITPLEANLSYFVDLTGSDFCGKTALIKQKEEGIPRTLRGIKMIDRGVPRQGYPVFLNGSEKPVGYVTSGTKSPTTENFIGLILIERGTGLKIGDTLEVEIHNKRKKAELVKTPFYKKNRRQ